LRHKLLTAEPELAGYSGKGRGSLKISGLVRVPRGPQESGNNTLLSASVLEDYVKGRWRLPYLDQVVLVDYERRRWLQKQVGIE